MYTYRIGIEPKSGLVGLGRACVAQLGPNAVIETVTAQQLKHRVVMRDLWTGRYRLGPARFREPGEEVVARYPFRWRGVWGAPRTVTDLGGDARVT